MNKLVAIRYHHIKVGEDQDLAKQPNSLCSLRNLTVSIKRKFTNQSLYISSVDHA